MSRYTRPVLLVLFLLISSCTALNRKTSTSIKAYSLDKKFFKAGRRNRSLYPVQSEMPVTVTSLQTINNTIFRFLFNTEIFNREEVGTSFNSCFIYFDPLVEGTFTARSSRILDFTASVIPDSSVSAIIPAGLTALDGSTTTGELRHEISFNLFYCNNITPKPGTRLEPDTIIELQFDPEGSMKFNPDLIEVNITPESDFSLTTNDTALVIKPEETWPPGSSIELSSRYLFYNDEPLQISYDSFSDFNLSDWIIEESGRSLRISMEFSSPCNIEQLRKHITITPQTRFSIESGNNEETEYILTMPYDKKKRYRVSIPSTFTDYRGQAITAVNRSIATGSVMPVIPLGSSVNLEHPVSREFTCSNIQKISCSYYRINDNEIPSLIKASSSLEKTTALFKDKEWKTHIARPAKGKPITVSYVPGEMSGLFACRQTVTTADDTFRYFQVHNIASATPVPFETEESVMLSVDDPLYRKKTSVHWLNSSGKSITKSRLNESLYTTIPNRAYRTLYTEIGNSRNMTLYRIELSALQKTERSVFMVYDNSDPVNLYLHGIIRSVSGKGIKNIHRKPFSLKIFQNSKMVNSSSIDSIDQSGYFSQQIEKSTLSGDPATILLFEEKTIIKEATIQQNDPILTTESSGNPLSIPDSVTLINDTPLEIIMDDSLSEMVESVLYYIYDGSNKVDENIAEPVKGRIRIGLPDEGDSWRINLEIILKTGKKELNTIQVNRIRNGRHEMVINKTTAVPDDYLDVYNPFKNSQCMIIVYNHDIRNIEKIDLQRGNNRIERKRYSSEAPNTNVCIVIRDLDNDNTIYDCRQIDNPEQFQKRMAGSINDRDSYIRVEVPGADNKYNGKKMFIFYSTQNRRFDNPLFNELYRFNDPLFPSVPGGPLLQGTMVSIDSSYRNYTDIGRISPYQNYQVFAGIPGLPSRIYYLESFIARQTYIAASCLGPSVINPGDKPRYTLAIRNIRNTPLIVNAMIDSRNGFVEQDSDILSIEPGRTKKVEFTISEYDRNLPVDFLISIIKEENTLLQFTRRVYVEQPLVDETVEFFGSIIDDRQVTIPVKISDRVVGGPKIHVSFARDNSLMLLRKRAGTSAADASVFEHELLSALESIVESKILTRSDTPPSLDGFKIRQNGIRQFPTDTDIDLDSTLLYLFALRSVPALDKSFPASEIINNLTRYRKKEILDSPFRIFVCAEYSIFFKEISREVLEKYSGTMEALFFHRYYKREKMTMPDPAALTGKSEARYQGHQFSDSFYKSLDALITGTIPTGSAGTNPSDLLTSILTQVIMAGFDNRESSQDGSTAVTFSSPLLGTFTEKIEKRILLREFEFDSSEQFSDQDNMIQFRLEQSGSGKLYYLIQTSYRKPPLFPTKNSSMELASEWRDSNGRVFDPGDEHLLLNNTYTVTTFIINDDDTDSLVLTPSSSGTSQVLYDSFRIHGTGDYSIDPVSGVLFLKSVPKGVTSVEYKLKINYPGQYLLSGSSTMSLYRLDSTLQEQSKVITVQ
jgi:hypothetical protein